MTSVIFGCTSSPFLLGATIKEHIKKYQDKYPEACELLQEFLYVDDLIGGSDTDDNAYQRSKEIKLILKDAGMNMRKWRTNSNELREKWNNESENSDIEVQQSSTNTVQLKILGLLWRTDLDEFSFDATELLKFLTNRQNTKRSILQAAGRVYDPIGYLSPYTVRVKMLFQELWQRGVTWDDELPADICQIWSEWCQELPQLNAIVIPRYYFADMLGNDDITELQLHCFSDASPLAYGSVIYLRFTNNNGMIGTILVAAKARVASLKKLTLPRLELMGALLGVRLSNHIVRCFLGHCKLTCFFWTDSMIALHWIKGSSRQWKPFVQNRTIEIQEKSEPSSWSHCPGSQNPADVITRGAELHDLKENSVWWIGPEFLRKEENEWPRTIVENLKDENIDNETRNSFKIVSQVTCTQDQQTNAVLNIEKYSNLTRLLRVTAWMNRFVWNSRHTNTKKEGTLTAEELHIAEVYWIRHIQHECFPKEIRKLTENNPVQKSSKIYTFNPFLDDKGLLRVGGRLHESNLKFEEKHPLLLPDKSHFTDLIIKRSHERLGHAGVAETLVDIRERYWIIKGRQRVKSMRNKCTVCKKFSAKPMTQETAPLPSERVTEDDVFSMCALDFCGPVYVKERINDKGNKAYIALFSCGLTRAIHLEAVSSMNSEMFLLAFRRFVGRRGLCRIIYSDNAKTFKKTDKELKEIWKNMKEETLREYFGNHGITWKYICEKASWWGGVYERMVRSVKTSLKKIMGKACLTFEELQTTLVEVEAILNSRPLSFTYSDVDEPTPLTPGHFLIGKRVASLPTNTGQCSTPKSTKEDLTRRYKYRQTLLDKFWKTWRELYLMNLRSAHNLKHQGETVVKENSLVLVAEDRVPRLLWPMGLIIKTHVGRDGKVRACSVRLTNKKIIRRPVQLLYNLELD